MESPIKVLLVEDDLDWIKAITTYLNKENDLLVVGAATNSTEAIQLAQSVAYDVVLMDIRLTGSMLDGIYTAIELHEIHTAKVIMLTSMQDEQLITQAFHAGAVNYIDKSNYKTLPHAIRMAHHHPAAMDVLLKEYNRLKREEQLNTLTASEREVFELIEEGYTQSQIEGKLHKSESTLKNQVNKILKKLGVKSSKEAVRKVRRNGLTPDQQKD